MRHIMFSALLAGTLAISGLPSVAQDAAREAQTIITSQIEAFLSDDTARAYSFAAPIIKQLYPDPERFMQMVRQGYSPVYRPGNVAFGRSQESGDGARVLQEVLLTGPGGEDWTALYTLERQADGSYKIAAVRIVKAAPPST